MIAKKILIWILPLVFAATPSFAAIVDVSMENFVFVPANITINVGDTVRWTNNGNLAHTSTSTVDDSNCVEGGIDPWDSGIISPGQTFQRTFTAPGTYPYACDIHCSMNMRGTVTVVGPDFSISCDPILISGLPGGNATSTCTVSSIMSFNNAVDLDCSGLPSGATCGFVPDPVTPPENGEIDSSLTVSIDSAIPSGTYDFQVTGTGPNFSRTFAMVLAVSDFSISSSPSSLITPPSGSSMSTTTITSLLSFNDVVDLSCTGLPAGATCNFNPSSVTPPPNESVDSTLTLSVSGVAEGIYPFQVSGTSGVQTRFFDMSLTVTSDPVFSLSCSPTSVDAPPNGSATTLCTIASINSYSAPVNFSCSDLPTDVTCSFNPNPVTPPPNGNTQSTLTIDVGPNAEFGSNVLQVDGTDGTLTHSAGITVNVNALFIDDFEDGDAAGWTFIKGNWSVVSGDLVGTYGRKATAIAPFTMPVNATVEAEIKTGINNASLVTLIGWQIDKRNTVEVILKELANKVVLKHKVNGQTILKAKSNHLIGPLTRYRVRVTYTGTAFIVFIDGNQVISVNATSPFSGTPGFKIKATTGILGEIIIY